LAFSSKILTSTKINSDCDNDTLREDLSVDTKLEKNNSLNNIKTKPTLLTNENRQKTAFQTQKTIMTKSNTKFIPDMQNEIEDIDEDDEEEIKYQILDEDTLEMIKKAF